MKFVGDTEIGTARLLRSGIFKGDLGDHDQITVFITNHGFTGKGVSALDAGNCTCGVGRSIEYPSGRFDIKKIDRNG